MESEKSRTGVVVGVVLLLVTCAVLAMAVSVVGWFALQTDRAPTGEWSTAERRDEVRIERRFDVGAMPELEVDNFAGSVTVRDGSEGQIYVVATKRSRTRDDLGRVDVQVSQDGDKVLVRTRGTPGLRSSSVQIQISVPADTLADLHTNAGEISVEGLRAGVEAHTAAGTLSLTGLTGEVRASSNAGSIDARDVSGEVHLSTNAGSIKYQGDPQGECEFRTNAGSITLRLPEDLDMELDLSTGVGSVEVDYQLGGRVSVSRRQVRGVVGSGADGKITAHTSAGSIELIRR